MNFFQKTWNKILELASPLIPLVGRPPTEKIPFLKRGNEIDRVIQSLEKEIKERIVSIDREINELNTIEKQISDSVKAIVNIKLPDLSSINASLEELNQYISEKPKQSTTTTFFKPKTTQGFEDLLKINNLLKQFQDREIARKCKEEQNKKEVRAALDKIATCINQDKLDEAKTLISQIQDKIKNFYKHEIERLEKSKQKLKDRELQILKKQQEEEQKRCEEEAKRIKEAEEKRQEKIRRQQELEKIARKAKEEQRKKQQALLNELLKKKPNWEEFQKVLQDNGITTLYHFTDRANISSIKENGGLYSWSYCNGNGIDIPYPGGDSLSRDLDTRYNLQDYVRASFTRNHPMMYVARNEGRIQNSVILTISLEVAYLGQTRFANMNATRNGHKQGPIIDYLKAIHFETVKSPSHFDLEDSEKPYFQAEVLVKTWIPIEYITNINDF
jgi:chemotaxis protein histidine kinase CheA